MVSPIPILTPPPKKEKARATILPTGLRSPVSTLKEYSTWALACVAAAPEAYVVIASSPWAPDEMTRCMQYIALAGFVLKFIKQQKPDE